MNELFLQHQASFELFCEELLKWNQTHNLTGYRKYCDIKDNILSSIEPLSFINDFQNALDIGSGCGFPAICLAIIKRESRFTLVEPNNKRASFLKILTLKLGLKNTTIIKDKIQNLTLGATFDLITSRAFEKTPTLIALSQHLLKDKGYFLFYKGSNEFKNQMQNQKIFYFYQQKFGG